MKCREPLVDEEEMMRQWRSYQAYPPGLSRQPIPPSASSDFGILHFRLEGARITFGDGKDPWPCHSLTPHLALVRPTAETPHVLQHQQCVWIHHGATPVWPAPWIDKSVVVNEDAILVKITRVILAIVFFGGVKSQLRPP